MASRGKINTKEAPPKWDYQVWTIKEIRDAIVTEKTLKIDPIGNRPSGVDSDANEKNVGIINSVIESIGIGSLILRDISNSATLKALYKNTTRYVVADGGHRCRAVKWFLHDERFPLNINDEEVYWSDLNPEIRKHILNFPVPVSIVTCNNKQAKEIFIAHNKTTKVKGYSIIMSDEESEICKYVRQKTKSWAEYKTNCHPIFYVNDGDPACWYGTVPNKDNLWDTFVFVIIHKVMGKGNASAGEKDSKHLVDTVPELTDAVKKEVDKFLDTFYEYYCVAEKVITNTMFGCFQAVYFQLYQDSKGKMTLSDMDSFAHKFNKAVATLTDPKNPRMIEITDGEQKISRYIDINSIAFSKPAEQEKVAKIVIEEMQKR